VETTVLVVLAFGVGTGIVVASSLTADLEQAWRDFAGWRVNYDRERFDPPGTGAVLWCRPKREGWAWTR
jgi:hypothetical protein